MSDRGSPPPEELMEDKVEEQQKDVQPVSNKDVFGDSDDEEEAAKPSQKSGGDDSDASGGGKGGGSDSDDSLPKRKKKKKEKKDKSHKKERKDKKRKRLHEERSDDNRHDRDVNVFAGGSDDEDAAMADGQVIDTETGEVVKDGKKKRLSKKQREDLLKKEREMHVRFVAKLKEAAMSDRDSFKRKTMATRKAEMLPELIQELSTQRKQQDYLDARVLDALKLWLDPLDEKKTRTSLPNTKIIQEVLDLVFALPIDAGHQKVKIGPDTFVDNMAYVNMSQIGHSIALIKHLFKDDKKSPAFRSASKVIQKWSRIIFNRKDSYSKHGDDADDDDEFKPKHIRANREWEKMPDNVRADGSKAVKGDFGFRYGASVPRPMLFDFVKQPASKVDLEDLEEASKQRGRNSEVKNRLIKVTQETKRATVLDKNSRAEAPEVNRIHVGGVAAKVASMGWAVRDTQDDPKPSGQH